jgi:hypothetical protein
MTGLSARLVQAAFLERPDHEGAQEWLVASCARVLRLLEALESQMLVRLEHTGTNLLAYQLRRLEAEHGESLGLAPTLSSDCSPRSASRLSVEKAERPPVSAALAADSWRQQERAPVGGGPGSPGVPVGSQERSTEQPPATTAWQKRLAGSLHAYTRDVLPPSGGGESAFVAGVLKQGLANSVVLRRKGAAAAPPKPRVRG